jgi:adenosylhomocysteine nucleosidase
MTLSGVPSNGSGQTAMYNVGIVAALEREVRPFLKGWHFSEREYEGRRFRFFERSDSVLIPGGIGPEAARRAAEALIVLYRPKVVYSVGYAGALNPSWKVGDLVRPARVINSGDSSTVRIPGGEGVLVSYSAVTGPQQKMKLRDAFAAQAVDMEASAVASAAQARGVEFRAVKVISDEFGFELPPMDQFVDSHGCFSEARFVLFAAIRPWLWSRVIRLARNSWHATRVLSEQLEKIIGGHASSAASLEDADRRSVEQ